MTALPDVRALTGWFTDRPVGLQGRARALGTLALVAVGMTGLAADRIAQLRDAEHVLYTDTVLPLTELSEIQRSFQGDRARVIQYGIADVATRQELRTDLAERRKDITDQIDAYRPQGGGHGVVRRVREQLAAYYALAASDPLPSRGRRRRRGLQHGLPGAGAPADHRPGRAPPGRERGAVELAAARAAADREDAQRALAVLWIVLGVGVVLAAA